MLASGHDERPTIWAVHGDAHQVVTDVPLNDTGFQLADNSQQWHCDLVRARDDVEFLAAILLDVAGRCSKSSLGWEVLLEEGIWRSGRDQLPRLHKVVLEGGRFFARL